MTVVAKPDTNIGKKFYICATAQTQLPLDATAFAALTWVQIKKVGKFGEHGSSVNIVKYDTFDDAVTQKGKGKVDAGDPEIEVAHLFDDPGQIALRAAALTDGNYAFKIDYNDAPTSGHTSTLVYNCGLVSGPKRPASTSEDFIVEVFTLGFNQDEVKVNPTTIP